MTLYFRKPLSQFGQRGGSKRQWKKGHRAYRRDRQRVNRPFRPIVPKRSWLSRLFSRLFSWECPFGRKKL